MAIVPNQTVIKPLVTIKRERALGSAGEIVVRLGQQVTPVQVVARAGGQVDYFVVPAGEMLGMSPDEVAKNLLVEEGAAVQKGTALVRKTGLLSRKRIASPVDGVLYQVKAGRLIIQQSAELVELRAMMHGFVSHFVSNRGVMIETTGSLIQAGWSPGREGYGQLQVVTKNPDDTLRPNHIGADARGKVIVAGRLERPNVLERAEENSIRGLILGSVPSELRPALEAFALPVVVMDGFGYHPMNWPAFQLLKQSEGRDVCLLSRGPRPEIIIPLPVNDDAEPLGKPELTLKQGQTVRILRQPYLGQIGEVATTYTRSRLTDVGFRTAGADVTLSSGHTVFIPYTNLDIIR